MELVDALAEIWKRQAEQQKELGLDPADMSDVERRKFGAELALLMHEEVSDCGRISGGYKRHILRSSRVDRAAAALEAVDVLKLLVTWCQLLNVTPTMLLEAFELKTLAVEQKAAAELLELTETCRVIATDLDDVICDLAPWREELRRHAPEASAVAALRLEASENMKAAFYAGGRFREMAAVEGAIEGLHALKADGFKIVIITARPQWQYKRLHADTVDWLARHGVPYDLLLFTRNKVEAIYEHVRPAWPLAFVEDHPNNADAIAEAGIPVMLLDQPHNQVLTKRGVNRCANWPEIVQRIRRMT